MIKELETQLNQVTEVVDFVHQRNKKTMFRYHLEKREIAYRQIRLFARKIVEFIFPQVVYMIYKLDELI